MKNNIIEMSKIITDQAIKIEKLEACIKNIFVNTIYRELDPMYEAGVLTNIQIALREKEYKTLESLYKEGEL